MGKPHVVILGGGPAGVGAAFKLRERDRARVTLLEQNTSYGGNAGSFEENGLWLDYGSHRLHPACAPEILSDIRGLLGDDLRDRTRHGRIRLRGKWVRFPLSAPDLMLKLDRRFAAGAAFDMIRKQLPGAPNEGDSFASVLRAQLGPTICDHFYYPYARKLWGCAPETLSGIQAERRVSSSDFGKLLKKILKPPGSGRFYYPKEGFGQISRAYGNHAQNKGADMLLGWRVTRLSRPQGDRTKWIVEIKSGDGDTRTLDADFVWSTIPLTTAAQLMDPTPPEDIMQATEQIQYRAMLLVYLELDVSRFTTTDAHYFPEERVTMTRLSEPKNYWGHKAPKGRTILCAELPCRMDGGLWSMEDEELGRMVADDMAKVGLPLKRPVVRTFVRRLPQAYPIYLQGYENPLGALDRWLGSLEGFLSYGRQGLFAHDNTHHALFMAYSAVECLQGTTFDRGHWNDFRKIFKTHVVED